MNPLLQIVALSAVSEKPGHNPRKNYGGEDFDELVASVRDRGVMSPPLLREAGPDSTAWHIVAGHRRIKAAREAGLVSVSCLCLPWEPGTDAQDLATSLAENLQRRDMSAIEKAQGFQRLIQAGMDQPQAAAAVGVSKSYVCRLLSLLSLPVSVQQSIEAKQIPADGAYQLVRLVQAGVSTERIEEIGRNAALTCLHTYEVQSAVSEEIAALGTVNRRNEVSVPLTSSGPPSPLPPGSGATWAIAKYGTVEAALSVLRTILDKDAAAANLHGTVRDPMAVVNIALEKRWRVVLVAISPISGVLVAAPAGPLPVGYKLIITLERTGGILSGYIAPGCNGPSLALAQDIKRGAGIGTEAGR